MHNFYIFLALIFALLLIGYFYIYGNKLEHYNDTSGKNCITCQEKNFNQCLACYNCVWCEDEFGNSGCIGGNRFGPYNNERCQRWRSGDPYVAMVRRNNATNSRLTKTSCSN